MNRSLGDVIELTCTYFLHGANIHNMCVIDVIKEYERKFISQTLSIKFPNELIYKWTYLRD